MKLKQFFYLKIKIFAVFMVLFLINPHTSFAQIIFNDDFESGILDNNKWDVTWWTDHQLSEGIQPEIVTYPVRAGNYAVKMRIEYQWNGIDNYDRTELQAKRNDNGSHISFFDPNGSEYWIGFSCYLPSDWEVDNAEELIFQLHGNGDGDRSPSLALYIDGDEWYWYNRWQPDRNAVNSVAGEKELWRAQYEKGQWVDWVIHAIWSYNDDGYLEIYKNGTSVAQYSGPNCYNDSLGIRGPQTGVYKWPWLTGPTNVTERIVYLDEFKVGGANSSYDDVAPRSNPDEASSPSPVDGATNVNINADISWTAGSNTTSHDVYFGTSNPPPFVQNQSGTSYDPGTLEYNTTYYWRIDEKNSAGTTTGKIWSFTTESLTNLALNKPVSYSSQEENHEAVKAVDGIDDNDDNRWSGSPMPQWIEVDLGQNYLISRTELVSFLDRAYHFKVEAREDGSSSYFLVVDRLNNTQSGTEASPVTDNFAETSARYVRLTVTGAENYTGTWASIKEFRIFGKEGNTSKRLITDVTGSTIKDKGFALKVYPNPTGGITHICFNLPEAGVVTAKIFSITGKEMTVITRAFYPAGNHTLLWNVKKGQNKTILPGVYYYRIMYKNQIKGGKIVIVK